MVAGSLNTGGCGAVARSEPAPRLMAPWSARGGRTAHSRAGRGLAAGVAGGLVAAALLAWIGSAAAQQRPAFSSAQAAIEGGLGAYQAGLRDNAISALTEAAARGDQSERFIAEFYLAR